MSKKKKRRGLRVSRHAIATYSRRRNDPLSLKPLADVGWSIGALRRVGYSKEDFDFLVGIYNELEQEIRECVTMAIEEGKVLNHKPDGFVLYGRRNATLPSGQRFVRCDEDSNYGFILKPLAEDENVDLVVTTITRAGVRR